MINSTDLKNGVTFLYHEKPFKVIKYSLIKMGRGGATVKVSARNIETGSIENLSFSSNIKVDSIDTSKKKLQFLYQDNTSAVFMDGETYEQVEIPISLIETELPYIKVGENANIFFWGDKPLSIDILPKVVLTVVETDPGVKGNSATNVYKPAKLENGLEVKVPLFIKTGEKIRVDTRTGAYVERANE